jgi:adenylylsulfate kinase
LRISHLCQLLNRQGIHVICSVLSIFHESQRWNRENLEDYFEVYIEVSMEHLESRDPNGLYLAASLGQMKDVVGVDIPFPPPAQPDVVVRNEGTLQEFLTEAEHIVGLLPELTAACHP